jgi:hypothetical protein
MFLYTISDMASIFRLQSNEYGDISSTANAVGM